MLPWLKKKWTTYTQHAEIYHICCSLTTVVGCRSRQSPWCVQRSDDELNAVCLCPGRDHHINIVLIQRSVCCMLITTTLSLTLSLPLNCETCETHGWQTSKGWLDLTCWLSLHRHNSGHMFYASSDSTVNLLYTRSNLIYCNHRNNTLLDHKIQICPALPKTVYTR